MNATTATMVAEELVANPFEQRVDEARRSIDATKRHIAALSVVGTADGIRDVTGSTGDRLERLHR